MSKQWNMTEWHNPSKNPAEVRVFVGPGNTQVYKIPPGGHTVISEEYDEAIRTTREGVVIGGLCPWLLQAHEVQEPPKLASALTAVELLGQSESTDAPPVVPPAPPVDPKLEPLPVFVPPVDLPPNPEPSQKKK